MLRFALLELAGAYAGLARGGEVWTPKLTPRDCVESRRLASPEACAIIADILCDNRARLAGFGASSPLNLARTHRGEDRHEFRFSRWMVRGIQQEPYSRRLGR